MKLRHPAGATPLTLEDFEGLRDAHISTQEQLNAVEAANIKQAMRWAATSRHVKKDIFALKALLTLHKQMFGDVWRWAGTLRRRQTNIGVAPEQLMNEYRLLEGNARYWIENAVFPIEEIAIRYHHELVRIHLFPNGNGRHARLMAELFLRQQHKPLPSWGSRDLVNPSEEREQYLLALRAADRGDIEALMRFAFRGEE